MRTIATTAAMPTPAPRAEPHARPGEGAYLRSTCFALMTASDTFAGVSA